MIYLRYDGVIEDAAGMPIRIMSMDRKLMKEWRQESKLLERKAVEEAKKDGSDPRTTAYIRPDPPMIEEASYAELIISFANDPWERDREKPGNPLLEEPSSEDMAYAIECTRAWRRVENGFVAISEPALSWLEDKLDTWGPKYWNGTIAGLLKERLGDSYRVEGIPPTVEDEEKSSESGNTENESSDPEPARAASLL